MTVIYLLTNTVNGKRYVGKTTNFSKRMREHRTSKNNSAISRAIVKYGWDKFKQEILTECDETVSAAQETCYIEEYKTFYKHGHGYNLTLGGEGTVGFTPSEESRTKMREAKLGKKLKLETVEKMRANSTGRIFSTETRSKIASKLVGNQNGLGTVFSEEARKKISIAKARHYIVTDPQNNTLAVYNMREFCKTQKLHVSAMSRVANGLSSHHKGYKVVFAV